MAADKTIADDEGGKVTVEAGFHPFAMIPEALLLDERVNDKAVRVYGVLLRHAQYEQTSWLKYKTLAKLLHCSADTAQRAVALLVEAGWLTALARYKPDGSRRENDYVCHATPRGAGRKTAAGGVGANERPPVAAQMRLQERESVEREPITDTSLPPSPPARAAAEDAPETDAAKEPKPKRAQRPNEEAARALTKQAWEARPVPPAGTSFIGVARIVERFMDVGRTAEALLPVLIAAPALTGNAIEFGLNRKAKSKDMSEEDFDRAWEAAVAEREEAGA